MSDDAKQIMSDQLGCAFFQQTCPNGGTGFLYDSTITDKDTCRSKKGFPLFYHNAQKLCAANNKEFLKTAENSKQYLCCDMPAGTVACKTIYGMQWGQWVRDSCTQTNFVPWACTEKSPCYTSTGIYFNGSLQACKNFNPNHASYGGYGGSC